jgi:hypothetical protein
MYFVVYYSPRRENNINHNFAIFAKNQDIVTMNIVFLLRYWPIFGGGETVTLILANKLASLGYNVSVVYLWERKRGDMPFIDDRIRQCVVPDISAPGALCSIRKPDYKVLKGFLNEHLLKNEIDIVINQWWPAQLVHKAKVGTETKLISCHHMNVIQKPTAYTIIKKYFTFYLEKLALRYENIYIGEDYRTVIDIVKNG